MSEYHVNVSFRVYWRFKDFHHLKITKCKKIINEKTSSILKYNQRGYFINGRYYNKKDINKMIEKIPDYNFLSEL